MTKQNLWLWLLPSAIDGKPISFSWGVHCHRNSIKGGQQSEIAQILGQTLGYSLAYKPAPNGCELLKQIIPRDHVLPIPFSDTLMEYNQKRMILLDPYWIQRIPSTARILNYFCSTLYAMLFPLFLPNQGFIVYILLFIHCIGCTWGK